MFVTDKSIIPAEMAENAEEARRLAGESDRGDLDNVSDSVKRILKHMRG